MRRMRRETVTIGRKILSYLIVDPPGPAVRQQPARTVVFLHAFPLHAEMWSVTLGAVPDGWRAIAPDLRGLGHTPLPASDLHHMNDFAGDVVDLLDHLNIHRAAVVGCSMGGYVLFEMLDSAPTYVGAVGLVSTRAGADNEEGRANRDKMIDLVEREGVEAVAAQMTPKLIGKTTQEERPNLSDQVRNLIRSNTTGGVKTAVSAMKNRRDFTALLGRIDVPTLVVHGSEDALIPPAEAETMHRGIRHSQLELISTSGHLPNVEQPGPFSGVLWEFLNKL